jgi:1-deoxy-D-xylulose-5-phosphate synthase
MVTLARKDKSITAISAAMKSGVGLDGFAMRYPKRFFDVGIAEQHAATLAAAMALHGLKPVVAIYSTFLQRAYDQILHDVCLQNARVVFAVDRAGVVGEDGETHQGLYDMAFLRHMPNISILAPASLDELEPMLRYALYEAGGPVAIRYPRGGAAAPARGLMPAQTPAPTSELEFTPAHGLATAYSDVRGNSAPGIVCGKGELVSSGGDITIVAVGAMLGAAERASRLLGESQIGVDLISARFVKPMDEDLIAGSVEKTGRIIVVEDGCVCGGFGSAVLECLARRGVQFGSQLCGFPDEAVPHGSRGGLLARYGLSAESIYRQAVSLMALGAGAASGATAGGAAASASGSASGSASDSASDSITAIVAGARVFADGRRGAALAGEPLPFCPKLGARRRLRQIKLAPQQAALWRRNSEPRETRGGDGA